MRSLLDLTLLLSVRTRLAPIVITSYSIHYTKLYENELYKRADEVLHYIWDPVGVADSAYARDEYWGYLPKVFSMLLTDEPAENIVEYLLRVESESMGLAPDQEKAKTVVGLLQEYKEKIWSECP